MLLRAHRACSCRVAAGVLSAGLIAVTAPAEAAEFKRAPTPSWVVTQALDTQAKPVPGQAVDGEYQLLSDVQTQLDRRGRTTFHRHASRALNGRGVEEIAHVGIDFDPSYQVLSLHTLNLVRDGRVQDRLSTARIKVLQRETELEYRIYDGSRTLEIHLDDVRPGDIVDFAYSVQGSNPVFGGREFGTFDVQWRSPVHRMHRRLRLPAGRDVIGFQAYLTALKPTRALRNGWIEYVWQADIVPPLPHQTGTPSWYDSNPGIRWSAFADWREVARWAEPLYALPVHTAGALRAEVERIAAQATTPEQRTLAVLDFVQSQVRYVGIETGPGSPAPRLPDQVLEQRFGDCKDKVRLAVTLLRALGIDAHAALVSTRLRQEAAAVLPSPQAFNHVIVRVQLLDQVFWLDPTRAPQKGGLTQLAQASFGKALVLDGQADALVQMPETAGAQRRRDIAMRLDASAGFAHASTLEVTTTFDGAAAEGVRETLRNDSTDELQREHLGNYRRFYPTLEVVRPMTVADDEAANRVVTTEFYRAESLWARNPLGGKPLVFLSVPEMRSMLRRPDDAWRTAPLAVEHPEQLTVSMTALLPDDRVIPASASTVVNRAFVFTEESAYADRTLRLRYSYRSRADHVAPGELADYLADLDTARSRVGYTLRPVAASPAPRPKPLAPWLTAAGLLLVLGLIVLRWARRLGLARRPGAAPTVSALLPRTLPSL